MSYLCIGVDGELSVVKEITDDDKQSVANGDLQVIRSVASGLFQLLHAEWIEPDEPEGEEEEEAEEGYWETDWEAI